MLSKRRVKALASLLIVSFTLLIKLVMDMLGILSAASSKKDGEPENGDLIGDYNFRTGKFDNGTDPYGWYEDDL
jgi:hypothetical protein